MVAEGSNVIFFNETTWGLGGKKTLFRRKGGDIPENNGVNVITAHCT